MSAVTSLKRGGTVLIMRESEQLVGQILTLSLTQLGLQTPGLPSRPFGLNEKITLRYWDNDHTLYSWGANIDKVTGYGHQIVVSILSGEIQRRKYYRFQVPIEVLATIVEAAEGSLKGQQLRSETRDISAGGLLLETTLPLKVGDKLQLSIRGTSDDEIQAHGWIVRSQRVTRTLYETGTVRKSFNAIAVEFLQLGREDHLRLLKIFLQTG